MTKDEMKSRTKAFGLRVIRVVQELPRGRAGDVVGAQLIRCGTSVGANYRAACRARSPRDFVAKLAIVEEEADECLYWLEVCVDAGLMKPARMTDLMREGDEILAIIVSSINTARARALR